MDANCLACHREIQQLIDERRGLHGREAREKCATCHPEHGGVDFQLIVWPEGAPDRFDHRRTGWALSGPHLRAKCGACHGRAEFRTSPALRLAPAPPAGPIFIGLETGCRNCHEDIHGGALGDDCRRCHAEDSWKAPHFDHQTTAYPLRGRHRDTPCVKCHLSPRLALPRDHSGAERPLYKPVPHGECSDCHRDPHAGALGAACSRCHQEESFRSVGRGAFDHDRTHFPLRGKHASVSCAACHDPGAKGWLARPASDRCEVCHRDAHAGQASIGGQPADCKDCHTVDGYAPSTFSVERHAAPPYPLLERHRQVACKKCHPKNPTGRAPESLGSAAVLIRRPHEHCADCHADPHGGQLRARADGGACEACHGVAGFKPSTYTAAEHNRLPLPLAGRHAAIPCAACHALERPGLPAWPAGVDLGTARVGFRSSGACAECHGDPHDGRFEAQGERPAPKGCLTCHGADQFRPALVDAARHGTFGFPLDGAHGRTPCDKCHLELTAPAAKSSLLAVVESRRRLTFRDARRRCEECHPDPHRGQFASRADRGACSGCHGVDSFRPAVKFDHQRDSAFPLKGAHVNVACARCHRTGVDAEGRPFTIFKPTPTACNGCHGPRPQPAADDSKPS